MLKEKILIDDFKKIFNDSGFKCTPTRLSIIQVFLKNKKPISAEFIFSKLKKNIDEATIYRSLTLFEKNKILKRVDLRKDAVHFELNNSHHHHLVCTRCGEIEDFKENNEIEKILRRIVEKSSRFKIINEHSLELFGLCSKCV